MRAPLSHRNGASILAASPSSSAQAGPSHDQDRSTRAAVWRRYFLPAQEDNYPILATNDPLRQGLPSKVCAVFGSTNVAPALGGHVARCEDCAHTVIASSRSAWPSRSSSKWQNEPKFNFKQSHICFSRKPCRFRDPVALAFVWRMPDARSVRASATWGGRESAQCLVPVQHSTRQYSLRA